MLHPKFALASASLVLIAAACGGAATNQLSTAGSSGGSSGDAGTDGDTTGQGDGNNLPCDVEQLLQAKCQSCHGSTPSGGAPMSMVTYADMTAPSKTQPSKTVAQLSVERMQSTTSPMPPGTSPSPSADVAVMQNWVNGGTPQGTCGSPGDDAGTTDPYATPTVCTSGATWTRGNHGSSLMHPGGACITCHTQLGGPFLTIGGTIYPTAHEPDDCNGESGATTGLQVIITDKNGAVHQLPVNTVGNFYYSGTIATPFTAKITANGGKERAMQTPQTSGDCNSCHTETGANGAPGRIMAP